VLIEIMTTLRKDALLLGNVDPAEAVQWLVREIGFAAWFKRADELTSIGLNLIMERHHVEICLAAAFAQMESTGFLPQLEQPFLDAFGFAMWAYAIHNLLPPRGQRRHLGMLKHAIKCGFGALRTEYTAMQMGLGIGCDVDLVDLGSSGTYDFTFKDLSDEIEVECKFLTHDFARSLRVSDFWRLCRAVEHERPLLLQPGTSRIA
jgi:hypothetical protein